MKKLVLILLLAGIAGFGAMTVWGSLRAKQEYRSLILAIAESPDARILETSYERGWLLSKSRANVEIRGPLGAAFQRWLVGLGREEVRGRVGVRMQQTIEHGYAPFTDWLTGGLEGTPIIGRIETHFELDEETQSEISAVLGRLPSVSIFTVIRVSGVGESSVIVPAQRLESKLAGDEGSTVKLDNVLMVADGDKVSVGTPTLDKASVTMAPRKRRPSVWDRARICASSSSTAS